MLIYFVFDKFATNGQKIALKQKQFKKKFKLTKNYMMLVNLETILGFILEFKITPSYIQGHMVSEMSFDIGVF